MEDQSPDNSEEDKKEPQAAPEAANDVVPDDVIGPAAAVSEKQSNKSWIIFPLMGITIVAIVLMMYLGGDSVQPVEVVGIKDIRIESFSKRNAVFAARIVLHNPNKEAVLLVKDIEMDVIIDKQDLHTLIDRDLRKIPEKARIDVPIKGVVSTAELMGEVFDTDYKDFEGAEIKVEFSGLIKSLHADDGKEENVFETQATNSKTLFIGKNKKEMERKNEDKTLTEEEKADDGLTRKERKERRKRDREILDSLNALEAESADK